LGGGTGRKRNGGRREGPVREGGGGYAKTSVGTYKKLPKNSLVKQETKSERKQRKKKKKKLEKGRGGALGGGALV